MTIENGETPVVAAEDAFLKHFGTRAEAEAFIAESGLKAAIIENASDDFILAPLAPAFNGEVKKVPAKAKAKAATKGKDAPQAPDAKAKGKGKGTHAERIAKRGAAIEKGKADRKAAAELAKAKAEKAGSSPEAKNMFYSGLPENMPTREAIESGSFKVAGQGLNLASRELYRAALGGALPEKDPFDVNAATHKNFLKHLASLKAAIAEAVKTGDIKPVEGWRGHGTRMNSSSTHPLGRFHQQAILALRAKFADKAAAKAKREAKKAAKLAIASGTPETPADAGN